MKIKTTAIATAVFVAALFNMSYATIQPKRVGPVSQYGALQSGKNAKGEGRIYGKVDGVVDGKEVQVKGMSLTWSMYWPYGSSFYGNTFIDTLVGAWNVEIVRSAMGVVPPWGHGSYMARPEFFESQMDSVVQAAIENDIYVLIDWHSEGGYYKCIHPNGKPTYEFNDNDKCFSANDAAKFYERMAKKYGKYPHVIFEIYNEPVSESWADLKAYADTVSAAIRKYSDNLIVIGTPMWSSKAGDAVSAPVQDKNIAYTYHFYADLHKVDEHTASSNTAMAAGLSVFVTEWGGIDEIFSNANHKQELEKFLAWTTEKKLSYAKWDVQKPFLENNDVDNYIKENILPKKTTYTKRLNWETEIVDELPNLVTYSGVLDLAGKWNLFSDETEADADGNYGTSTFTDNSSDGVAKMDNINLDAASAFSYSPYVKADYTFEGEISNCKLIEYTYKGSNHQFTLYYDWNQSIEILGTGAWDFPYVEMPLTMNWETVRVDMGWMMSNNWQEIPTTAIPSLASALRFNVIDVSFSNSLWIKDVKCITSVEGYTPVQIPENTGIANTKSSKFNYNVMVQGKNIIVSGITKNTRYVLSNMLGQVIASGSVNKTLNIPSPQAGHYVLRLGSQNFAITIK